jgi:hypothetical protein
LPGLAQEAEKLEDLTPTVSGYGETEEKEGADANTSFTDSDGEDDDPDMEQSNFQNLIATARQRGTDRGLDNSVQSTGTVGGGGAASPAATSTLAVTSTPVVSSIATVPGTTAQGDRQVILIQKLMDEVQNMKTEQASFRQQAAIGEALNKTSGHMVELPNTSKRVREEKKELPEDPVLVTWSPRGEKAVDDNHSQFAWGILRMVTQANKVYWSQAKYKMKVEPNLRESLFLQHLGLWLNSKALGWAYDLLANTAIKYYTHKLTNRYV